MIVAARKGRRSIRLQSSKTITREKSLYLPIPVSSPPEHHPLSTIIPPPPPYVRHTEAVTHKRSILHHPPADLQQWSLHPVCTTVSENTTLSNSVQQAEPHIKSALKRTHINSCVHTNTLTVKGGENRPAQWRLKGGRWGQGQGAVKRQLSKTIARMYTQ